MAIDGMDDGSRRIERPGEISAELQEKFRSFVSKEESHGVVEDINTKQLRTIITFDHGDEYIVKRSHFRPIEAKVPNDIVFDKTAELIVGRNPEENTEYKPYGVYLPINESGQTVEVRFMYDSDEISLPLSMVTNLIGPDDVEPTETGFRAKLAYTKDGKLKSIGEVSIDSLAGGEHSIDIGNGNTLRVNITEDRQMTHLEMETADGHAKSFVLPTDRPQRDPEDPKTLQEVLIPQELLDDPLTKSTAYDSWKFTDIRRVVGLEEIRTEPDNDTMSVS